MNKVSEVFHSMEYGPSPETPDQALEWIRSHEPAFDLFIDGSWRPSEGGASLVTSNPATGLPLARVALGNAGDVARAVEAARRAQAPWSALGGPGRARYLYALARRLQRHARLFAVLESLDSGKAIRESRDLDIPLAARHFLHHAGWAQLMEHEFPDDAPIGVIGQIIPWNFPLLMLAWKVAPALAMGNTVVLKPAEFTPLTALRFGQLCAESGLPPGVVNIVTGDGATGAALVAHPDVDKIAFTGSTEVGREIRVVTAGSGKRLSLELGGKSPFVVFDDADLDSVVEGVVDSIWFNQGQVCCAGSRLLVHEGVAPLLEAKVRSRMETLRVGDPLDKSVDMGPIIAPVQLERIQRLVTESRNEGARIWQPSWTVPEKGWFYPPTLCTNVSPAATIARVEVFGPVAVMMTFRTPKEAVAMANDTRYGLAASVWTENVNLALDVASSIKAGSVWVNCTNMFDAAAGFGGYQESGFGREGGREGLLEYVRPTWESPSPEAQPVGRTSRAEPLLGEPVSDVQEEVDRTAKLYIGGKQVRPDGSYSIPVVGAAGSVLMEIPRGNRKDIRNAVEAARSAAGAWAPRTGHNRAQILYYLAENLAARSADISSRLISLSGDEVGAKHEVEAAISRLFTYAAWADKYDGRVHHTPFRNVTLAMPEPLGVVAVVCPASPPLLGLVSTVGPTLAMGNAVVAVASDAAAVAAVDFYSLLETSDVPAGAVNIVTGDSTELTPVVAAHDDVDAIWYFGSAGGSVDVERLSAGNLKRTWVNSGRSRDWYDPGQGEGEEFLREATQIKNIWVPYGE